MVGSSHENRMEHHGKEKFSISKYCCIGNYVIVREEFDAKEVAVT